MTDDQHKRYVAYKAVLDPYEEYVLIQTPGSDGSTSMVLRHGVIPLRVIADVQRRTYVSAIEGLLQKMRERVVELHAGAKYALELAP